MKNFLTRTVPTTNHHGYPGTEIRLRGGRVALAILVLILTIITLATALNTVPIAQYIETKCEL